MSRPKDLILNSSGVYEIKNTVNGKIYIGSAHRFGKRWAEHRRRLRKGIHYNTYLQCSFNKYNEDVFEFKILFKCPKEYCIKLEQWCIDKLKPEYNICKIAGNRAGHKQSPETLKKRMDAMSKIVRNEDWCRNISKGQKGRVIPKEAIDKMMTTLSQNEVFRVKWEEARERSKKPVYQYDKTGTFIAGYESLNEAARKFNTKPTTISNAAKGIRKTAKGFLWKFTKNEDFK